MSVAGPVPQMWRTVPKQNKLGRLQTALVGTPPVSASLVPSGVGLDRHTSLQLWFRRKARTLSTPERLGVGCVHGQGLEGRGMGRESAGGAARGGGTCVGKAPCGLRVRDHRRVGVGLIPPATDSLCANGQSSGHRAGNSHTSFEGLTRPLCVCDVCFCGGDPTHPIPVPARGMLQPTELRLHGRLSMLKGPPANDGPLTVTRTCTRTGLKKA